MPAEEGQKLRHACSTCCRSFGNKRDLVKHQYMHREKPNLVCLHCNKTFTTECNYRRHINALQNVEKKGYNCGNCGILFRRLRDLEEHHELKHRDDKVFRCNVCQAEFSWQENLLKHQQVHEVNPHICTVCNHEFIDMTSLLVHRRTHHPPLSAAELPSKATRMVISQQPETSAEKPFTCHICGRRFKFDFSYQAHLDAHVIPASKETSVDMGQGCEPIFHLSKPVYVQMDSEGIIDLPAFSSSTNEDVEIIVEVGNVATPAVAAGTLVSLQNSMITEKNDRDGTTIYMKSELDKRAADDGELLRTSELLKPELRKDDNLVTGATESHEEQETSGSGSVGKSGQDIALKNADENEGPPKIDRMDAIDAGKPWSEAVASFNSYSSRPKKPTKRKRERVPFQFNCVMTDDKPFVCSICGEAFRWEISLQVHTKVHTEGKVPGVRKIYNSAGVADKKKVMKCKEKVKNSENAKVEPGMMKSRIVYRRDSSDEEDVEEDTFAFSNDPEQEQNSRVVHCHGKKFGQRTLRPDNADDMLLEYLVGEESFISLDDSNSHAESTIEDYCQQPEEDVLQNKLKERHKTLKKKLPDDSWKKGKAILRKKRVWKQSKQRPEARTDATLLDSDKESICEHEAVEPETLSGNVIEKDLGGCDMACERCDSDVQQAAKDADEDEDKPCWPQDIAEQSCPDGSSAADSAAFVGEGGGAGSEVDDRIVMTAAYASATVAEPGLLNGIIIKEEMQVNAEAEQCEEDAMCLPVAMDTGEGVRPPDVISHQDTASEQVQNVNACSSIALLSSLHHQTSRGADDAVAGKKSPTLEVTLSGTPEMQENISVPVTIPSQRAKTEPQATSVGSISSRGDESEPQATSIDSISSHGDEAEPHTTSHGSISSQAAEAEPHATSVGLTSPEGTETDAAISALQLKAKEPSAAASEFKCDYSCPVGISIDTGNTEHVKDSMDGTHFSQPVIKNDVSVLRMAVEPDQHCLANKFYPALIPSASTTTSLSEGNDDTSSKQTTLDISAGSIYYVSPEPDQMLVQNETLKNKYPVKPRNLRQLSGLYQSFKAQNFHHKSLTLNRSSIKKIVRGRGVVIPSNAPKSAQGTISKNNCGQCDKNFTSERSLKRHQLRHRSSLTTVSFKCSYCLRRFSTMASLDQHLISSHVSSVASCETCQKQFTTLDSCTLHRQHGCVFSAFERK